MMVDLDVLKKVGIDYDSLKVLFKIGKKGEYEVKDDTKRGKIHKLKELIRSRVQDGRDWNLTNHRVYKALDDAWDTPLRQTTPTMLMNLIESSASEEAKMDTLKSWGISPEEVMVQYEDPKTPGKMLKKVSIPAFFRVYVPLVRAYVTIRWAKIMNDRRLVPFYKYEPAISDKINRTRCEVITQRIEVMSKQYGYYDTVKQAVLRMLVYSEQLQFPVEPWDRVCQVFGKDSKYKGEEVKAKNDKGVEEVIGKKVVTKEGLRYHLPHPTRTFYDRAWFPSTFNSDSGASFAGYWRIVRYREMLANKDFYNLDRISVGDTKWFENNKSFFTNVYPCTLKFPAPLEDSQGKSKFDSESHIAGGFYQSDLGDVGAMQTELFMRLVPSEYGLGDYDYPVWFRFVIAGDDTIIYCAPLPYSPVVYYGYDSFEGRTMNASLAMEILPFQDQFSNLLSQYLLTVKQNLFNLTLVDTDVVEEDDARNMENWTQKLWSGINVVRISLKKLFKQGAQARALYPEKLPQMDTQSISSAMSTVIEILERVLVVSSQEVGQPASHEQTREEVRNIATNTSTRQAFTASAVDVAREATKQQLYEALMAYGDLDFYAQVPADPEITEAELEKNGFTVAMTDERSKKRVLHIKDKTAIQSVSFASSRDGDDRINNLQLAQTMGTWMMNLLGNPMMAQAIGPDQAIQMANMIAKLSGFPRDFKLMNRGPDVTPEEQQQAVMQDVQAFVGQAMEKITSDIQEALTPIMDVNNQQTEQITALAQQQAEISQQVEALTAAVSQPAAAPMEPAMDPNASVAAGQVPVVDPAVMNDLVA